MVIWYYTSWKVYFAEEKEVDEDEDYRCTCSGDWRLRTRIFPYWQKLKDHAANMRTKYLDSSLTAYAKVMPAQLTPLLRGSMPGSAVDSDQRAPGGFRF